MRTNEEPTVPIVRLTLQDERRLRLRPARFAWLWVQGNYDPMTRTIQVWPEGSNEEAIYGDVVHDRRGTFGESACWCQPRREVQPNGTVLIIHSIERGGSDSSVVDVN